MYLSIYIHIDDAGSTIAKVAPNCVYHVFTVSFPSRFPMREKNSNPF